MNQGHEDVKTKSLQIVCVFFHGNWFIKLNELICGTFSTEQNQLKNGWLRCWYWIFGDESCMEIKHMKNMKTTMLNQEAPSSSKTHLKNNNKRKKWQLNLKSLRAF